MQSQQCAEQHAGDGDEFQQQAAQTGIDWAEILGHGDSSRLALNLEGATHQQQTLFLWAGDEGAGGVISGQRRQRQFSIPQRTGMQLAAVSLDLVVVA